MATQLQIRRGTTAQMNAFTGAEGEIAVNTSTDTVHVHDGATAGGFALAKADGSNIGTYAGSFTTLAASGAVTLSSTLTVSGNVGIGVTPESHYTGYVGIDFGKSGGLFSNASGTNLTGLSNNAYLNSDASAWVYKEADEASYYNQTAGTHRFSVAPSGTAGNAITWSESMRLSGGNLLVGKSTTAFGTVGIRLEGPNGKIEATRSNNIVMDLNRLSGDGTIANFSKDGSTVGSIGVDNNDNFQIGATTSGHGGLYFGNGSIAPMAGNSRVQDTLDLGNATYRFKDLHLSGAANVGSIVQTGSSSSLVANFTNTNTNGFGMRITTYSSGAQYGFAVDSYGGGYSRDFVIGVDGYIYSLPTYGLTTGGSANMFVATDGSFQRSVSSARYKNTITDATHGLTELLTLRPVTYKGNNDADTVFGGLIAEEVHDAGLTEFVQYNDEDEPDALAYGNMVSLCIKAIQEQQATIEALTQRIQTLENK